MKFLAGFLLILLTTFNAQSQQEEQRWTIKSLECSSGTLQPNKAFRLGIFFSPSFLLSVNNDDYAVLETATDAVYTIVVSGSNDGICAFDGHETILIINFSKLL